MHSKANAAEISFTNVSIHFIKTNAATNRNVSETVLLMYLNVLSLLPLTTVEVLKTNYGHIFNAVQLIFINENTSANFHHSVGSKLAVHTVTHPGPGLSHSCAQGPGQVQD